MSETINDDSKELPQQEPIIKKVYVTNSNYDKYYNKLEKEHRERIEARRLAMREATRLKTPGGRPRPLLQSEIEDAQEAAYSAKECARILGVSYPTYKKYAKMYGVFDKLKNQPGIGITKYGAGPRATVGSLEYILEGKNPNYPIWKLRKRLLDTGYMPRCCANCGYDEERVVDGKVPILLDFVDGDRRNHKFDNLRMLCYNCWFQINGDLFGKAMRNVKRDAWDFMYIHK